jgi:hypothetical protein
MMSRNKKIVIFVPYGNGDILMLIPALRRLISSHGVEGVVVVVASKLQAEFVKVFVGDRLAVIQRFDGNIFPNLRLFVKMLLIRGSAIYAPMLSRKFQHLLFFFFLGKNAYVPCSFISKRRFNFIPQKYSLESFPGHQVNYYVQFIASLLPLELNGEVNESEIILSSIDIKSKNMNFSRPSYKVALGISCGLLERHKIPSPNFFANLINLISEKANVEWLIFGVNSDKPLIDELSQNLNSSVKIQNIFDLDFIKAIDLMSTCDLGISGTTGQGHMMASAGIPILVLAGVTEPLESGPYSRRVSILRHRLPCGPCYQVNFKYGCSRLRCMDTLNVEDGVIQALKLLDDSSFGMDWRGNDRKTHPISVGQINKIFEHQNESLFS